MRAVARYDSEHKAETRRRILETAGRRLKQDGIDGSGVAGLMTDAGLTNGAFYAHFESKDDLVANVVADQLATQCAVLDSLSEGRAALEEFIRDYLAPHHRDDPSTGCPSAALRDPSAARTRAIGLFTLLVATLQLARAVSDPKLSDDILESGIRNAETLLDRENV
jgi:TetR/AcrR family transcriptional regulator, transcriptional repressor for nem operon